MFLEIDIKISRPRSIQTGGLLRCSGKVEWVMCTKPSIKVESRVALKVLNTNSDADSVKRFYFEAQAMRELDHQKYCACFDFGQEKAAFYCYDL